MFNTMAFLDLGTPELVIILLIVLLLFGGKKLPELSRSLGKSMGELKKGMNDLDEKPDARQTNADHSGQSQS